MMEKKIVFISWAPYCSRSDTLARRFGGESIKVHFLGFRNAWHAPLKYLMQFFSTLATLFQRKPDIVFVMNPPVFAPLTVWLYCALMKKSFIMDSHTGSFLEPKWVRFEKMHAFIAKRARVSIVTNKFLADKVASFGGKFFIIPDVPVEFDTPKISNLSHPHITVVNTFAADEPVEAILGAAALLPQVNFSVTGNLKHASKQLLAQKPVNLNFTGFLSNEDYVGLLAGSDAVLVLTTTDFTMQRGAYEAMSLGVPVITSDWELLRSTFYKGTVYVDNSVQGIASGINLLLQNAEKYKGEIKELKVERRKLWTELEVNFKKAYLD